MPTQIRLNALDMNCVGGTPGLWLHPEDEKVRYNSVPAMALVTKHLGFGITGTVFRFVR